MSKRKRIGRPPEGRKKVTWYVKPPTVSKVRRLMTPAQNTPGKVIDVLLGVER